MQTGGYTPWSCVTWSTAFSSGATDIKRTWTCWHKSRGEPQRWSEGWSTPPVCRSHSCEDRLGELGTSCCEVCASPPSAILSKEHTLIQMNWGAFVLPPSNSRCKNPSTYFPLGSVLWSVAEHTKGNQDKHHSERWLPPVQVSRNLCHV